MTTADENFGVWPEPKRSSDYGFCRVCYTPLPPGGQRAIGVCTECALRPSASTITVPQPSYAFGRRDPEEDSSR